MFEKVKGFLKKKEGKTVLFILAATLFCFLNSGSEAVTDENGVVLREGYDGNTRSVLLEASIEGVGTESLEINVKNRQYTESELSQMHDECIEELGVIMLNNNPSLEEISDDLYFPESLSGYPFELSWNVSKKDIFDSDGKLIAHEGGAVDIVLSMTYEEWVSEDIFNIHFNAAHKDEEQLVKEDLIRAVTESEEEDRAGEFISLPLEINGLKVTYMEPETRKKPVILLLGVAAAFAVLHGSSSDRKKEEKKKKEAMTSEYVTVIMKMVMYLSSGMNIRNVWVRIYEDSKEAGKDNPIYREMGITVNELKTGVSEGKAYKEFSKRVAIPAITRFTTLLTQNLKKGSTNLSELLSDEAREAFEERKRRARALGEEAGTKLILPMVLLMLVVMLIIMVPAFWGM